MKELRNIARIMSFIFIVSAVTGCNVTESDVNVNSMTDLVDQNSDVSNNTEQASDTSSYAVSGDNIDIQPNSNNDSPAVIGLETYSDKKFGYALSYMSNFTVNEKDNGVIFENKEDNCVISVTVMNVDNTYNLEKLTTSSMEILFQKQGYVYVSQTRVGNFNATSINYIIEDLERGEEIVTVDGNLAYVLNLSTSNDNFSKYKRTFDDIAASFKLIEIDENVGLNNLNSMNKTEIGEIGSLLGNMVEEDNRKLQQPQSQIEQTTEQMTNSSNTHDKVNDNNVQQNTQQSEDIFNKLDNIAGK